jgi:hypothetical protein
MKPYRILITGSRDWTDENLIRHQLTRAWLQVEGPFTVVHGGCPTGADWIASDWVANMHEAEMGDNITEEAHPADWDHCTDTCPQAHRKAKRPDDAVHPGVCSDYCPSAGPRRNRELIALGPDRCLAFIRNGSRGASHTAVLAEKAGIPVSRWTA